MPTRFGIAAMGSKTARTFLINEDCEGTGVPAGWTTVSGSPNWDYTTVPLAGAQSLYIASAAAVNRSRVDFTDQTEVWIYFLFRLTNGSAPGVTSTIGGLGANGGALNQTLSLTTGTRLSFASFSPATALIADTTYHVWLHYKQGSGANAAVDIGFSTTGIRPTSGGTYASSVADSSTNLAGRFFLGPTVTTAGYDQIWDNIRIAADSQIGDSGT